MKQCEFVFIALTTFIYLLYFAQCQYTTIWNDNFDTNSGWTCGNGNFGSCSNSTCVSDWKANVCFVPWSDTQPYCENSPCALICAIGNGYKSRWLQKSTNIAAYSALELQFSVGIWNKETKPAKCQIYYSYDAGAFQNPWERSGDGTAYNDQVQVLGSTGYATNVIIKLQVYGNSADCDTACYFDNVILNGIVRTDDPTVMPTTSNPTTSNPTTSTLPPTKSPSKYPSKFPTQFPTTTPTNIPTEFPSKFPTQFPTISPTKTPTPFPTIYPTYHPTHTPTQKPTHSPSVQPSNYPTTSPTHYPTYPTFIPSTYPSNYPTIVQSVTPTMAPVPSPTLLANHESNLATTKILMIGTNLNYTEHFSTNISNAQIHHQIMSALKIKILIAATLVVLVTICCCILAFYFSHKPHKQKQKHVQTYSRNTNPDYDYVPLIELHSTCKTPQGAVTNGSTPYGATQTDELADSDSDDIQLYKKPTRSNNTKGSITSGGSWDIVHFYYMDYVEEDNKFDIDELYHEKQSWEMCLLHSLNALLQKKQFTVKNMNKICKELAPNKLINPHKAVLGTGNYDANVLMMALGKINIDVEWFDARKANKLDLMNDTFLKYLEPDKKKLVGFILNTPQKAMFKMLTRRHWIAIKEINGMWYNLDSKLKTPKEYANAGELTEFLRDNLSKNGAELMICRKENTFKKEKVAINATIQW